MIARRPRSAWRLVALASLLLAATGLPAADPVLPPLVDAPVDGPLSATWLGQLTDRTGYANHVGADGRLDITVLLRNLPPAAVTTFQVGGLGGGLWQYRADGGATTNWAADLIRVGSQAYVVFSTSGQAFPRYDIQLRFDDGSQASVSVTGGAVDANRWTAAYQGAPEWRGAANALDITGWRKGPDGIADDEIWLPALYPGLAVKRVVITRGTRRWTTGPPTSTSDGNVDLVAAAPGKVSAFFADPDAFTADRYQVAVTYDSDAVLTTGIDANQPTVPGRIPDTMPATPPPIDIPLTWRGQDPATGLTSVTVGGIAASASLVFAEVTDDATGVWRFLGANAGSYSALVPTTGASALTAVSGAGSWTLSFLPTSDLSGRALSVRVLALVDGTLVHALGAVTGGATDPAAGQPAPDVSSITAQPGDDLNALALTHGHITLAPGDYALDAPLSLTRPIEITGPRTARLVFHQGSGDAPWSRAVELCVGRTALRGFSIAFTGAVRFKPESQVSYGPAVIGTVVDRTVVDRRADLRLEDMSIEGPAALSSWEEAVHLVVMKDSSGGAISGNLLHGGTVRLLGGPWRVTGNTHLGALVNTFSYGAFAGHFLHDFTCSGNRLAADPTAHARTWRFLVMTAWGIHVAVADNDVAGVNQRSDDAARGIPVENAPEVTLTEAYGTVFEGIPNSISADGRVLRIPRTLAGALNEKGAVTVLEGPAAGTWSRIRHVINTRECIVDPPLSAMPGGAPPAMNISDASFRDAQFMRNRIDLRTNAGGATALVLAGNHYGTRVLDNHLLGTNSARIVSAPTENQPFRWGWGYAPVVGLELAGNLFEDTGPVALGPDHSQYIKGGAGRTYFSAVIRDNRFRYSAGFLAGKSDPPLALTVGSSGTVDPRESRISWSGNHVELDPGPLITAIARIFGAIVEGAQLSAQDLPISRDEQRGSGGTGSTGCGFGGAAALVLSLAAVFATRTRRG
jgi:hypothetical protein